MQDENRREPEPRRMPGAAFADAPRAGDATQRKLRDLEGLLEGLGSVAVGFSGGVDSTFLAATCARCIPERTVLVHLATPFSTAVERDARSEACARLGLPLHVIQVDPLSDPQVASNPPLRCYHCKRAGFCRILDHARRSDIDVVLEGSNADDLEDYRPGMRAVSELGIRSPLAETGWRKEEERALLRDWGFSTWDLPAGACLATRVACGEPITAAKLDLIQAVERGLQLAGARQVRCRLRGDAASIEMSDADIELLASACGQANPIAARAGGKRQPDRADDGSTALPRELLPENLDELLAAAGIRLLDPVARPYRKGSMN